MANKPYANEVLSNEVEDQFLSHIDHTQFCTIDTELEGEPGMKRKIRRYFAKTTTPGEGGAPETSEKGGLAAEVLALKEGNSKFIEMDYGDKEYIVKTVQSAGYWYDEEQMTDPYVGLVIARYAGTDMFNKMNLDVIGEFRNTTQAISVSGNDYFGAFCDAQAMLPITDESEDVSSTFALVNKFDVADLRKKLRDDFKYVTEFARRGYVGTVGGTNLYVDKMALKGQIILGTRKAVTIFVKKGTEVEDFQIYNRSSADANIRKNSLFTRKYYLAALTDERYAVKISTPLSL